MGWSYARNGHMPAGYVIKHVFTKNKYFTSYKDSRGKISLGTDVLISFIRIGNIKLVKGNKFILENCLYIHNLKNNLISISKLD